jgi:hypothetical protein
LIQTVQDIPIIIAEKETVEMIYSVVTGILSDVLLLFETLFILRKKLKFKVLKNLWIHKVVGICLLLAITLHILFSFTEFSLTPGFACLLFALCTIASGVIFSKNRKNRYLQMAHLAFMILTIVSLIIHVFENLMYLFIVS